MKRDSRKWVLSGACVLAVAIGIFAVEWQSRQDMAYFHDSLDYCCESGTTEAFLQRYAALCGRDADLAKQLAMMLPWLVPQDMWDQIFPADGGGGRGGAGPSRAGASITGLAITGFSPGAASLFFDIAWQPDLFIPWGELDLYGKLDLGGGWDYLTTVDVVPEDGHAELEIQHSDLSWSLIGGYDFSRKAFFKFETAEYDGWYWDGGDDEEDDMLPMELLPAVVPGSGAQAKLENWGESAALSQAIPVIPGQHYLISVDCIDMGIYFGSYPLLNTFFSWDITVPGLPPLAGSTYSYTLAESFSPRGYPRFVMDLWFITIPTNAASTNMQVNLVIDPPPSFYQSTCAIGVWVAPFRLYQSNMPVNALPPASGSTDSGIRGGKYLAEGGTALITGEPRPPMLTADVPCLSSALMLDLEWRLVIITERADYRNRTQGNPRELDDRKYPGPEDDVWHATGWTNFVSVTQALMGDEVIGGKCKLYCRVKSLELNKTEEQVFNFTIRGMNPTDLAVTNYFTSVVATNFTPYAWVFPWHESRETIKAENKTYACNQFNPGGPTKWQPCKTGDTKDKKGNPVKRWGWGVCQIDKGPFNNSATQWVSTAEVYNWKTNCLAGAKVLDNKLAEHREDMRLIKATYPNEWTDPSSMVYTNANGITMGVEQYCVTVLYNGRKGCATTRVKVKDENGKDVIQNRACPLQFVSTRNPKWKFVPNERDYANLIAIELKSPRSANE